MLSALFAVWIAVIPLAIIGAAWAHARGRGPAGQAGADAQTACWERVARIVGRSRTMDLRDYAPAGQPVRGTTATAHLIRGAAVPLLVSPSRSDRRRACATPRLRGRGDAGRTGWS